MAVFAMLRYLWLARTVWWRYALQRGFLRLVLTCDTQGDSYGVLRLVLTCDTLGVSYAGSGDAVGIHMLVKSKSDVTALRL